jgi:hypothetical protein
VSKSPFSLDRSPKSDISVSMVNSHVKKHSDTESARSSLSDHDDTASSTTNGRRSSQGHDSDIDSQSSEHKARAAAKSDRKVITIHYVLVTC